MSGRLAGLGVLVTGGVRGIGRAIALGLVSEGARVLSSYRQDSSAASTFVAEARELGGKADIVRSDLGCASGVQQVYAAAEAVLGSIDVLVNNAAMTFREPFIDTSEEAFDRVLAVNLRAPFFLTQLVAKHMICRGIQGSIIGISSLSARRSRSRMAHYQVSKAGLNALIRSVAAELGPHGIRANIISPGLTATDANAEQRDYHPEEWEARAKGIPLARIGVPADQVGAAIFLASRESSWITGAEIVVDGGMAVL